MSDAESRWRRNIEWMIAREGVLPEDARDLAQEVAIGYVARLGVEPWNDALPQTALLYCLLHHVIASYHRRRAREREGLQRLCAHLSSTPQQDIEQVAIEHLTFGELLSQMSPSMREIAVLVLEGYTFREIAEQLGIPQGTVKARFYRGAEDLRQKVCEGCNQTAESGDLIIDIPHTPERSAGDEPQASSGENAPRSERGGTGVPALRRRRRRKSLGGGLVSEEQYLAWDADAVI